ncbi:MAG: hypothetical protein IPK99_04425 [Flavobacteriales bacterium]|nr:hypothetical protein [Flavobacteriales bacterium]
MRTFTPSLFLLLCLGSTSWMKAQPGTGTRFHLAYMANYAGNPVQALNVFVSSQQDAAGTLSIPGFGFTQGFTVVAGTTTTLTLPPAFMCTVSEFAESKGVLVETDVPVSVQALNFEQYTADGTNVWPEEMLGRDYFVMAYKGLDGVAGLSSEFLIVSTVDSIDVTITPSVVTATGRPAGVPFTVTLGAHQTYLVSALLEADDLTGSRIVAEVPQGLCDGIAVFGGSRCPNVPTGCYACDHLYEQLPPLSAWGTSYFSVPFTGPSSYTLRALASEDNTTLTYNGAPYSLDMGEVVEWNSVTTAVYIETDKPVSVAQYMEGTVCAQQGDPSMLMLSAEDQGVDQAIFSTVVSTVITSHRMGLVTDAINAGAVLLDGVPIPAASFTSYAQRPDKAYTDVLLTQGSHSLVAPGPFLAHNYGFGAAESYAQGIGSALPPALGQDSIICHPGGPITLDAPVGLSFPYWFDPANPSDTIALGTQYTFTPSTDMVIAVGDTGLAVCASGRQFHLELPITAAAVLSASADPVCAHHEVLVSAALVPPAALSLIWEQGNGLPDVFGDTITVQPLESTWYTAHFTTPFGCWQLSDSILVNVQPNTLISATATASGAGTCQGDSVQLTATAEAALAFDTFTGVFASWWSTIVGGTVGSGCGPLTDEHLVFDAGGTRSATTQPFDLLGGGSIEFDLFIGNGANGCDDAEAADDIAFEYSVNNGSTWIPMQTLDDGAFASFTHVTIPIPVAAQSPSTLLRLRQLGQWSANEDVWSIDNVVVIGMVPGVSCVWTPAAGLSDPLDCAPSASPANTTMYTVIMVNSLGACPAQDSVLVQVGQPFSVDLGPDTTLCGPVAFELTVDPWQTGWVAGWGTTGGAFSLISGPDAVIQLLDTALVSVEVLDSFGCLTTDTIVIEVVPAPQPFDILQVGNTLCVPTGPFIYAWELNWNPIPGGDGPCTDVVINGLYSVVVSNALGCTEGDTAYFSITNLAPTAEVALLPRYDAANGTLILDNTERIDLLQVHDPIGRLLFEQRNIPAYAPPVDLRLTRKGIHLVSIGTYRERSTMRIAVF